jgi:AcrR family transcriptional regulator
VSPRSGRRAGDSGTREAILASARDAFARHGYDGATIRGIAGAADVDPALVYHFFNSKEQLFTAALNLPIDPRRIADAVLQGGPREQVGERMMRTFLSVWREPDSRAPLLALLRSATTNEQAAAAFRQFITSGLLARIAEPLNVSRLRLEAVVAQMLGTMLLRYVVGIEPLASATDDEVVAMVAPLIQRALDDF